MLFLVWLLEIAYIITNYQAINKCEDAVSYLKSYNISDSSTFEEIKSQFWMNIVASLALCIALSIAYIRSYKNEEKIENIQNFLRRKFNKEKNNSENLHSSNNSNSEKAKDVKIESDSNPENIAKKDECPNCFHKIKDDDAICPNCGCKLKKH